MWTITNEQLAGPLLATLLPSPSDAAAGRGGSVTGDAIGSRFAFGILCASLCSVVPSTAVSQAASEVSFDIPFVKFVLPNGLTVITHEDHGSPIVAATVWYRVGTKDERQGRSGFAHLFEHLLLAAHDSLTSLLVSAGALELSGTYRPDVTKFYGTMPSSALDLLLFFQSELMGTSPARITQSVFDKERGIVKNENREYQEDRPYGRVPDLLAQASYPPGHPYASAAGLGSLVDLDHAKLDDAAAWLRTYYGPANAVLVVAGDFDRITIKEKVEKYFGDIPRGAMLARPAPSIARAIGNRHQVVYDRIPGARLYRVWNVPEWGAADATYLELVSTLLGGGPSSRLYERLVQRDKTASDVSSTVSILQLGGQLSVVVTPRSDTDIVALARALDEEVKRFIEQGPDAQELSRAQRRFRANFFRGIERIGSEPVGGFRGRSDLLAENEVNGGQPDSYRTALSRVARATTTDLRDAAARWLADGASTLELRQLPRRPPSSAPAIDRKDVPRVGDFPSFRSAPVLQRRLANGLRVLLVERPVVPIVELRVRISVGSSSDREGIPGRAALTLQMLAEGTTRRSAKQITDAISDMGARISMATDEDASVITLSGPADELSHMLDILADMVRNPRFPVAALQAKHAQYIARLQRDQASPGILLPRLLDGSVAQSSGTQGRTSGATSVGRDDLLAFHRAWFQPNNTAIVIAGAATMDALVPQIERAFGGWERSSQPAQHVSRPTMPESRPFVYFVDAPGTAQSVVAAGHLAVGPGQPDFQALRLIAFVLQSRLISNLRGDKQWSYAPYSLFGSAAGPQIFGEGAAVQQDKTADTMSELLKELRGIAGQRPITSEELERAKTSELRLLAVYAQTNALTARRVEEVSRNADPSDVEMLGRQLAAIGLSEISRVAARAIQPQHLVWLVIGDQEKIGESVRALKLGEFRSIAADGTPTQPARPRE